MLELRDSQTICCLVRKPPLRRQGRSVRTGPSLFPSEANAHNAVGKIGTGHPEPGGGLLRAERGVGGDQVRQSSRWQTSATWPG
ncbi:hypothetical protein QFZ43_000024 [Streptomyces afghaniensis]|nr:hypothetical protein [Streptomyces afghaniensis]